MANRRFPPPWTIEGANNACFIERSRLLGDGVQAAAVVGQLAHLNPRALLSYFSGP
jgi:hypothetical protein